MASLYLGTGPLEQELVGLGGAVRWEQGVASRPHTASSRSCGHRYWACLEDAGGRGEA